MFHFSGVFLGANSIASDAPQRSAGALYASRDRPQRPALNALATTPGARSGPRSTRWPPPPAPTPARARRAGLPRRRRQRLRATEPLSRAAHSQRQDCARARAPQPAFALRALARPRAIVPPRTEDSACARQSHFLVLRTRNAKTARGRAPPRQRSRFALSHALEPSCHREPKTALARDRATFSCCALATPRLRARARPGPQARATHSHDAGDISVRATFGARPSRLAATGRSALRATRAAEPALYALLVRSFLATLARGFASRCTPGSARLTRLSVGQSTGVQGVLRTARCVLGRLTPRPRDTHSRWSVVVRFAPPSSACAPPWGPCPTACARVAQKRRARVSHAAARACRATGAPKRPACGVAPRPRAVPALPPFATAPPAQVVATATRVAAFAPLGAAATGLPFARCARATAPRASKRTARSAARCQGGASRGKVQVPLRSGRSPRGSAPASRSPTEALRASERGLRPRRQPVNKFREPLGQSLD
jgi:hypothetical protein